MRFFATLYNSLYNFKWLQNQKDKTTWAWSYFFLLVFLISGLSAIQFGYVFSGAVPGFKKQLTNQLPDFNATLKAGKLEVVGITQPFTQKYDSFKFVLDTVSTSTLNAKDFLQAGDQSVILLTQDKLDVYSQSGENGTEDLKSFKDASVNKGQILTILDSVTSLPSILILTLAVFVGLMLFLSILNLFNVLWFGGVLYFLVRKTDKNFRYKQAINLGCFAVTFPFVFSQFFGFSGLMWLLSVGCAVLVYRVLYSGKK